MDGERGAVLCLITCAWIGRLAKLLAADTAILLNKVPILDGGWLCIRKNLDTAMLSQSSLTRRIIVRHGHMVKLHPRTLYSTPIACSVLTAAADLQNEGIDLLGVCLGRNRGVNGFLQPPARPTASAAHLLTFHPLVSVLIVGLSSGARNVPCYTRHIMQNFRTFRDSPVIPLRRSPRARDGDGGGGGCCNNCE